jgi:hypothetical protein
LDLAELRAEFKQDIGGLRTELKQDIAELRTELKQDIANLDAKYDSVTAELKVAMAALESQMLRWMGAGFAATIAILAAVLQFTHH